MKKSALRDLFADRHAEIGEYHGWSTALSFGDVDGEYEAAEAGRASFDHSMLGRIEVTGKDRVDLFHRLSTNAIEGLAPGSVAPTLFVTDKGRLLDQVHVAVQEDSLLLVCSPGVESLLTHWIEKYTITEDITLKSLTDSTTMVSLIGDSAISSVQSALSVSVHDNGVVSATFSGNTVRVVRRSDNRWKVAHVIVDNASATMLAESVAAAIEASGGRWVGSHAYEGFRVSRGIAAHPGELSESFNPFEVGLRESVSFTKGCYIGQEVIARLDTYGKIRRRLCGIIFEGVSPVSIPQAVLKGGDAIGILTSMTPIPLKGKYIGLAVVRDDLVAEGDTVDLQNTDVKGVLKNFPILQ